MWWTTLGTIFMTLCHVMADTSTNCRVTMREPRGVVTTPNFPDPYPVPIHCQWVIEAPADKVIAVYFTQFYMREGLQATEYAYYSQNVKMGRTEFGAISSEREPTYLVSNKPVLVLDFKVRELANIHMRVREYLLDVFGFNITYEFIARNESVRKDACLYHHCSFTGNCYASSGYDKYYCHCFSKYFGEECQYDQECGPTSTRSMCQNGGTCRYYIGSTVRTCECLPGFDGARCEAKKLSTPKQIGCTGPDCNATCTEKSEDEECARKEKKLLYEISLKLTNPKVNAVLSDRKKMDTFKKEMEKALYLLLKTRIDVMENITVLELRTDSIMKFHLLGRMKDAEEIKSTVEQMLQLGKLGSFDFDHDFQEFHYEPALWIERFEASEPMPVVEGSELTLACMIEGSDRLQVSWFKNGYPIKEHNADRGVWNTIVPRNSQQQFTALLGFDRVASLDTGVFTCRATDSSFAHNRSLSVLVLSAPQPQLVPMTATVKRGATVVVTCLSRDDLYGTFGYTWLKNGRVLNPSAEPETVEDLFPAGSRVLLRSAMTSATYSCIITSSAGSTKKDSVITVLDPDRSLPCCQPEDYLKVRWTLAASNTINVQSCPTGYTGDVRRKCSPSTNAKGAMWEEPDFSHCFSSGFTSIKRKVDSIRLGYLSSDVATLLYRLKRYLMAKKPKLHYSEGEPIVDLLQDIQEITHVDKKDQEAWPTFLDIASSLLESPVLIRKHSKIIQLHRLIFEYGLQYAEKSNDVSFETFQRKVLAVELGKIPQDHQLAIRMPTQRFSLKYSEEPLHQLPWMTNSVELDLSTLALENKEDGNSTGAVVVVFYKNLSVHLPQRYFAKKGLADVEYQLASSLVGVEARGTLKKIQDVNVKVAIANFNHSVPDKSTGWNISCAIADFSQGEIDFSTDGCLVSWTAKNITMCHCRQFGTYALLLTHYTLPEEIHIEVGFDAVAGTGCAICAFFIFVTIIMLLSLWRKIRSAVVAMKIQVCIALLGAFAVIMCGLNKSLSEEFYPYTVSLVEFFLLAAFSLQLCLALAAYIESVDLKNVHYSFVKISALGWAIPVIIVGATLAAQTIEGFVLEGWWITLGSNFFYGYTSSILILTMFQVLLFLIVKTEIRNHSKVADLLQMKKSRIRVNRVKLLHRSLLLTTSLLLVSIASILYVNFEQKLFEYFFCASSIILGIVVFFSYTFCSEKHFLMCCLQENKEEISEQDDGDIRSRTNSFKSFLKPEIVDDPYSRKMHIDAEKRAERIKRMYSQIEKASLSDARASGEGTYPGPDLTSEDAAQRTPLFRAYRGEGQEGDVFCDALDRGDGYPRMHWRYANHPYIMYGSPGERSKNYEISSAPKRPLLLQDSDPDHLSDTQMTSTFSPSSSSATFQPSQTVTADVLSDPRIQQTFLESFNNPMDGADDGNLKNSCFLQHTDSMETVVHCDVGSTSGAPLKTVSRDVRTTSGMPTWNMTTV